MRDEAGSLDRLHDIVAPGPADLWPLPPGWQVVFAAGLIVLAVIAALALRRWLAAAYRREALALLATCGGSAPEIARLLRRVALTASPRAEVAGLVGEEWLRWLSATSDVALPEPVGRILTRGVYRPEPPAETDALAKFTAAWIRRHRVGAPC